MKKNVFLSFGILLFLIGCGSKAPLMQAPPEKFQPFTIEAGQTKTIPDPKVDILFVVDNSGSMQPHQNTLVHNLDQFADQFFKNARVDYKIGVVPVYDRRYHDGETGCRDPRQRRKMNPYAELVPLKNPDGSIIQAPPYITRDTPNGKEVLKRTVLLGTQCGPEAEESFSPVLGVIDNKINKEKNANFYDKDAYLVVIFLTDADDVTPDLTAHQFYEDLVAAKGGDRNKVLIAAALPSRNACPSNIQLDGDGPIYKFPELISETRGLRLELCSDSFGKQLAKFGQTLVERVALQRLKLNFVPDSNISLSYGTRAMRPEERQQIPMGVNGGFLFEPESNTIVIPPDIHIQRILGGELFITVTPANIANYKNGRLKMIGQ